ncbi:MAG TPA: hypothetical protein VKX28_08975 [Xanthobacteraceae bacterium]|nr:hypothetical protein [Xanthobacteraceae bacterium]
MLLYITSNTGEIDRYEIGLMAALRIDDACGRIARRLATAALLALLSTSVVLAEKPASASRSAHDAKSTVANSAGDARPAISPTRRPDPGTQHHFGPRPDARDPNADKGDKTNRLDKAREGNDDRGTKPGVQHGDKSGDRRVDTVDVAVPRLSPRGQARDRLFKKIEAVRLAPIHRPHQAGPISPTGPARNAIGVIAVDPHGRTTHLAAVPAAPGRGTIGIANPAVRLVHVPPAQDVPTPPRGLINGTMVRHVGTGPGTLGGPPRVATGINGTTFKLKH